MHQGNTIFELKGQARRLRDALVEMNLPVSHVVALNLTARAQGARNWETLEAELAQREPQVPLRSVQALTVVETRVAPQRWLNWLEAALRMNGVTESDLDDLVHDIKSPREASLVNNWGMSEQLRALAENLAENPDGVLGTRRQLLSLLEDSMQNLALPLWRSRLGRDKWGVAMRLTFNAGSPLEHAEDFDALEWLANHSADKVAQLIRAGLANTSESDEVALWLEQHSTDSYSRSRLVQRLEQMRKVQQAHPDFVGLTVDIKASDVLRFLKGQQASGVVVEDDVLALLKD